MLRSLGFFLKLTIGLAVLIGGACAADLIWRALKPENTRHAMFGDSCEKIHLDYAKESGKAPPAHCIRVHFGTPRKPVGDGAYLGFGRELDSRLHLGFADVSLPLLASEEKDGQAGVRKRGEVDLNPDGASDTLDDLIKYASITLIEESGEHDFIDSLESALAESDTNALLVFVHGYNQSFDSALIRAAQISIDLTFDPADPANANKEIEAFGEPSYAYGRPVLFSWPNGSFLCAYCSDQKKADLSAPYLAEFLALLMAETQGVEEINIVVHSMGNRVLVKAIEDIAREHVRTNRIKKFRIVNAAADVERDEYAKAMARAEAAAGADGANFAPQVTIYASGDDFAMTASWLVNAFKTRLGQILPAQRPFESPNSRYVTVDTDVISADLFGHGYFSESGNVIADMSCFFADRPIGAARALAPADTLTDGRRHYRFVPPSELGLTVCAPGAAPLTLDRAEDYFSAIGVSYDDYGRKRLERLRGPIVVEPPAPAPVPAPVYAAVYFGYAETILSPEAIEVAREVARQANQYGATRIVVRGHADRAEDAEGIAFDVSRARAEAVKAELVANGVPADLIEIEALGADNPAKPTGDGVREPLNRRVEIEVRF